jgi:CHAD domain-containing protein
MQGTESAIGTFESECHRHSNAVFSWKKQSISRGSSDGDEPAWTAVQASICGALERIKRGERFARYGKVEGIHHLRTATRRLRSELRTLTSLVDPGWRQAIENELEWLAEVLGGVRDLDVLTDRLQKRIAEAEMESWERAALAPIFESLAARRERAMARLLEAMGGARYLSLTRTLERALDDRPWNEDAGLTCREALGPLAAEVWSKLEKHAGRLRPSDHDEAFHDVRKRAKRARYTAELVAPLIGRGDSKSALGFIRNTTRVQGKLGDHHDASIALEEIESRIEEYKSDDAFVASARSLIELERAASRRSRKAFFQAWEKLDRRKWRDWMKTRARVEA